MNDMNATAISVAYAASGDVRALETIVRFATIDRNPWTAARVALLVACDPDPSPVAAIAVAAVIDRLPPAFLTMVRRLLPSALRMLAQDDAAPLYEALRHRLRRRITDLGALGDPLAAEAAAHLAISRCDDALAVMVIGALAVKGWRDLPVATRQSLLDVACRSAWNAADVGIAAWTTLDEDERARVIHAAARRSVPAARLLTHVVLRAAQDNDPSAAQAEDGQSAQRAAPKETSSDAAMRAMLWRSALRSPRAAALCGGAFWKELNAYERDRVAQIVARDAACAARLIEQIGVAGWRVASDQARRALLDAVCAEPRWAAYGGAVWAELDEHDRRRIEQVALRSTGSAIALRERISIEGWPSASAALHALLDALADFPSLLAKRGSALWWSLNDHERDSMAQIVARDADGAAHLLERIGAAGLRVVSDQARSALIDAVCKRFAWRAPQGVSAVWEALDKDELARIVKAVSRDSYEAESLLESLSPDQLNAADKAARAALLNAVIGDPWHAASVAAVHWFHFDSSERFRFAQAAACSAFASAYLLERIAPELRNAKFDAALNALFHAACADASSAARVGVALWSTLDEEKRAYVAQRASLDARSAAALLECIAAGDAAPNDARTISPDFIWEMLLSAVAREPIAAEQTILAIGMALDEEPRFRLLRVAFRGWSMETAVAQAIQHGAPQRPWMDAFAADAGVDRKAPGERRVSGGR